MECSMDAFIMECGCETVRNSDPHSILKFKSFLLYVYLSSFLDGVDSENCHSISGNDTIAKESIHEQLHVTGHFT